MGVPGRRSRYNFGKGEIEGVRGVPILGQDSAWRSRSWPDNHTGVPLSLYSSARGLSRRDIVRLIRTFAAELVLLLLSLTAGETEPVIGNAIIAIPISAWVKIVGRKGVEWHQ